MEGSTEGLKRGLDTSTDIKCGMVGGLYTPQYIPYGMGGFQPHSMDSIWTIFWLATQPIFHSIPTMESIWIPYGMHHSINILCGFHGISNELTLQIHVLFHMVSMEESTSNSMENPLKVLSIIVSTWRIEHSTPRHITFMTEKAFLQLSHSSVVRQQTALS